MGFGKLSIWVQKPFKTGLQGDYPGFPLGAVFLQKKEGHRWYRTIAIFCLRNWKYSDCGPPRSDSISGKKSTFRAKTPLDWVFLIKKWNFIEKLTFFSHFLSFFSQNRVKNGHRKCPSSGVFASKIDKNWQKLTFFDIKLCFFRL